MSAATAASLVPTTIPISLGPAKALRATPLPMVPIPFRQSLDIFVYNPYSLQISSPALALASRRGPSHSSLLVCSVILCLLHHSFL